MPTSNVQELATEKVTHSRVAGDLRVTGNVNFKSILRNRCVNLETKDLEQKTLDEKGRKGNLAGQLLHRDHALPCCTVEGSVTYVGLRVDAVSLVARPF